MSKSQIITLLLIVLCVGVSILGISEHQRRKQAEKKLSDQEKAYLELMRHYVSSQKNIPAEIAVQLAELKIYYEKAQPLLANELQTILDLVTTCKYEIAIEKLMKIIENILKEKAIAEGIAKDKRTCPKLFKLLEMAISKQWISQHLYNFSLFLKDKRNLEAHEIGVKFSTNEKYIALFSGIEIITHFSQTT